LGCSWDVSQDTGGRELFGAYLGATHGSPMGFQGWELGVVWELPNARCERDAFGYVLRQRVGKQMVGCRGPVGLKMGRVSKSTC
jgi:hypothetical protein